jgi:hypothetical protein
MKNNAGSGAIYGLGMIGALVYYIQNANSLGAGLVGIIKAIFWPAVIVYQVLGMWNL